MPRPKIPEFWQRKIREIVANDPQGRKSAAQVHLQLKRHGPVTVGGKRYPVPSQRTVGRYLRELRQSPPAALSPYRHYSWPASHLGEGALPWEAGAAACELAVRHQPSDGQPLSMTNAEALWYSRLRQAIPTELPDSEFYRLGYLARLIAARDEAAPVSQDPDACTWLTLYIGLPKTNAAYVRALFDWAEGVARLADKGGGFTPRLEDLAYLAPEVWLAHDLVGALAMYFVGTPADMDLRHLPWSGGLFPAHLRLAALWRLAEAGDAELRDLQKATPTVAEWASLARDLKTMRTPDGSGLAGRLAAMLNDPVGVGWLYWALAAKSREIVCLLAEADRTRGRSEAKQLLLEHVAGDLRGLAEQLAGGVPDVRAPLEGRLRDWVGGGLGAIFTDGEDAQEA